MPQLKLNEVKEGAREIAPIAVSIFGTAFIFINNSLPAYAAYPQPTGAVYVEHVASGQRINMNERRNGGKIIIHPKDDSIDQKLWIETNPDGWTFSLWVDNTYARLSTQSDPTKSGIGTEVWMTGGKNSIQQTMYAKPREGRNGQFLLEFVINGKRTGQCLDVNGGATYSRPWTWNCDPKNDNQGFSISARGTNPSPGSPSAGTLRYLPFFGTSAITQGNNGWASHNDNLNRYAIDFSLPLGRDIATVAKGSVVFAGFAEQWGNLVVVKYDGTNIYGHYLHLSKISVTNGQSVSGGQKVGEAGGTFSSKGTVPVHLHYHEASGIRSNSIQMQNFQENIPLQDNGKGNPDIPVTSQNRAGRN
jgi:murein DD-endopeptidase MepM/ murein hydrolase activator NlpD